MSDAESGEMIHRNKKVNMSIVNLSSDDQTRLIVHVNHLYKIKLLHQHADECSNPDTCAKIEGKDLEDVIRGMIERIQRNQELNPVHCGSVAVTFNKKPWKISNKIAFKKNGKNLKVCPYFFEIVFICSQNAGSQLPDESTFIQNGTMLNSSSAKCNSKSFYRKNNKASLNVSKSATLRRSSRNVSKIEKTDLNCSSALGIRHTSRMKKSKSDEEVDDSFNDSQNIESDESGHEDVDLSDVFNDKKSRDTTRSRNSPDQKCGAVENKCPESPTSPSSSIPLHLLETMSAKKRKMLNDSQNMSTVGNRTVNRSRLQPLTEEEEQVEDIMGLTFQSRKCLNSSSVKDQSKLEDSSLGQTFRTGRLQLYNPTDAPLLQLFNPSDEPILELPSLPGEIPSKDKDRFITVVTKDADKSPGNVLKKSKKDEQKSNTVCENSTQNIELQEDMFFNNKLPLKRNRKSRTGHMESSSQNKKPDENIVDRTEKGIEKLPSRDRHLVEQEEVEEQLKLQELSKPEHSNMDETSTVPKKRRSLWDTLDSYLSPIKALFE